jgi:hypothetical protein
VDSQWYSGVVRQRSGSRTISLEPMPECKKPCLWFVESSVPPASEKYCQHLEERIVDSGDQHTSPPDRLVGMVMRGTVGSLMFSGMSWLSTEYRASSFGSLMLFARAWLCISYGRQAPACFTTYEYDKLSHISDYGHYLWACENILCIHRLHSRLPR